MVKRGVAATVVFVILSGCARKAAPPPETSDASVRSKLLRRVTQDQAIRDTAMVSMRNASGVPRSCHGAPDGCDGRR